MSFEYEAVIKNNQWHDTAIQCQGLIIKEHEHKSVNFVVSNIWISLSGYHE